MVRTGVLFLLSLVIAATNAASQEKPKTPPGWPPAEKKAPDTPKTRSFFEAAAKDFLFKSANSATAGFKGAGANTAYIPGQPLFEKRIWYLAYEYDREFICPQASSSNAAAIPSKLHKELLAFAKEKGARVEKKVIDPPRFAGTDGSGSGLTSVRNPWKSFAFQYESGAAHGLVQIRLHWQGKGTALDEKKTPINSYMLWITIEEWHPGAAQ
jgi:hypothetical protein